MFYRLVDREVVKVDEFVPQIRGDHRIGRDCVRLHQISTIFLGIDHGMHGKPLLFETKVFREGVEEITKRYKTYQEAKEGT